MNSLSIVSDRHMVGITYAILLFSEFTVLNCMSIRSDIVISLSPYMLQTLVDISSWYQLVKISSCQLKTSCLVLAFPLTHGSLYLHLL